MPLCPRVLLAAALLSWLAALCAAAGAPAKSISADKVTAKQRTRSREQPAAQPESDGEDAQSDPMCLEWAHEGECIRNPQYMFASCATACAHLAYVDLDDGCPSWASMGECEKNPDFMLEQCNSSCITHARRLLSTPSTMNQNDHTLEELLAEFPHAREFQVPSRSLARRPLF